MMALPESLKAALDAMVMDGQLAITMFQYISSAQMQFNTYFRYTNKYNWNTVGYMAYVKYDIDKWLDAAMSAIPQNADPKYVMMFQRYRNAFDDEKLAGKAKYHLAKAMEYLYYALNSTLSNLKR